MKNSYEKLKLFSIDTAHSEIIINQGCAIPATTFAKEKEILLIDGKQLQLLEIARKKNLSRVIIGYRGLNVYQQKNILGVINYIFPQLLSLESQIDNHAK